VNVARTVAGPLDGIRICDLSGQLAGAGATRTLAAFGAEVIRVEDPVRQGKWDLLRGGPPFVDKRRGINLGGAFNNHNVGKLGVTINTRVEAGRNLLGRLVAVSDVVTENFSAEVMDRWGFGYERLRALRPDVIYVSNCGFGHTGPYRPFRSWGPIVQALCGLTWSVGLADRPSAGMGFSYMDHHGANFLAFAVLAALIHRDRTGEGQWVDMSTTEAGASLLGPDILDGSVNGTPSRRPGMPDSNRSHHPVMAPHGIYPAAGEDQWVAIACRDDHDWKSLADALGETWATDARWSTVTCRKQDEDELDALIGAWTSRRGKFDVQSQLLRSGVPSAAVQTPPERIDHDPSTQSWGLWPEVTHPEMGSVRVDGLPIHLSETDWQIAAAAPRLGEHNHQVFGELLGLSADEIERLEGDGVI
jgi:crotonobetainyl-CoA:carnitine CoA-transferase CaiB-like acyl-CoA transferase